MLDFMDFKTALTTGCRSMLDTIPADSGFNGVRIEERTVAKAQRGELSGLIFRMPETVCAPTFYVEDFYDLYKAGSPLEELSVTLVHDALHYLRTPPVFPEIDADVFKGQAGFGTRLINKAVNRDYLKNIPYLEECGLALIAELRSGEYRAVITNELLDSLGMTADELLEKAIRESAVSEPATLYDLSEMFRGSTDGCENLLNNRSKTVLPSDSLYVLSNESCYWGASALLYPDMLEKLDALMGGAFYVLPSSVHEVLLLPASEGDPQRLADIIGAANQTVTGSDVFLSNDLFACEAGKLRQVSFGGVVPEPGVLPC
ncbi:MAG: hypothetical protein E7230_05770 [Clostridiales bacterium]|nr:hypothetical protein [Clostridiales bacterium]